MLFMRRVALDRWTDLAYVVVAKLLYRRLLFMPPPEEIVMSVDNRDLNRLIIKAIKLGYKKLPWYKRVLIKLGLTKLKRIVYLKLKP